jgi:zinc transport system substrate-binding protein
VTTIYYETLLSPAIAKTVAAETGAATAVLDPLEGLSGNAQGADYFTIMRANLANLQKGQPCP